MSESLFYYCYIYLKIRYFFSIISIAVVYYSGRSNLEYIGFVDFEFYRNFYERKRWWMLLKEDRLIPSITLTIYFGAEEWDGPLSLFDMMEVADARILSCMDNYHVRLIAPALLSDAEIMKFQTNLREVMLFIKYSKDKKKLSEVLKSNEERFRQVERRAANVIEIITHIGLKYEESEVKVDMCQAIQEMREESEQKGEKKGRKEKAQEAARNFYEMGIDVEKIAQGLGYAVETVKQWLGLLV